MKILYPNRVFLLRGNHETETVNTTTDNGLYETCIRNYGESDGRIAHSLIQEAFKYLPFCATVDNQIFCVHGGIPRMISERPTCNIMEEIRRIQIPWDNTKEQSYDVVFGNERNKLCYDLLWSDPFPSDMEVVTEGYPKGFAQSTRGHGPVCFDKEVVSNFLRRTGFTHIIRAHEAIDVNKNKQACTHTYTHATVWF